MKFLRGLLLVLVNGYILMFYSELVFWSRPRPEDSLPNWASTWVAYSLMGFLFLAAIRHFHVRDIWALFLCGALFGWLGEGVIVQTMYDSFPLQISWTGLAWHALISVWFGWLWVWAALQSGRMRRLVLTGLGLGLFWGFWAVFWWYEEPGIRASLGTFSLYSLSASILLILAYFLHDRLATASFRPPAWTVVLVSALFLLVFMFAAVPAAPLALLVLPPVLLLVLLALGRNRRLRPDGSLLDPVLSPVPPARFLVLLIAPLTAILFYAVASLLPGHLPTGWAVYLLTTPLGAILFVISLVKTWRKGPVGPASLKGDPIRSSDN